MPVLLVQEAIMLALGAYIGWKTNEKKHEIKKMFTRSK